MIKSYFLFVLLFTTIHSQQLSPCNITTDANEQNIQLQYRIKTLQNGRRRIDLIFVLFFVDERLFCRIYNSIYWILQRTNSSEIFNAYFQKK